MADKISVFGTQMNTPQAWRATPVPTGGMPQRFLALTMVMTMLAASLGVIYALDSDSPAGSDELFYTPSDHSDVIKPLLSERKLTSANLVRYDACSDLETDLKQHIYDEMLVDLATSNYYWRGGWLEIDDAVLSGDAESNGAAPSASQKGSQLVEGEDYSGTNNQEEGVDEADFVKTDGTHIFMLNGNQLEIISLPGGPGNLSHESTMLLEGTPTEMLMASDFLVVFSRVYTYNLPDKDPLRLMVADDLAMGYWRATYLTKISVIDIANPDDPILMREVYLEGHYKTAREVAGTVRMVSYGYMDVHDWRTWLDLPYEYWQLQEDDTERQKIYDSVLKETLAHNQKVLEDLTLEDLVPRMYQRDGEMELTPYSLTSETCADFIVAQDSTSRGFTSIFTLDLFGEVFGFDADHIMSNWAEVYASASVMVIAESSQDWWWFWDNRDFNEATNLHAFDISQPGQTHYLGSGRVNGTVNDQFSLSEFQGFIRVATTSGMWGRWWLSAEERPEPESHVWVLVPAQSQPGDRFLAQVGHVGGIAPGERLWSSRFVGEKGYLVTFENMDPLWTIDLSLPTIPRVIGELEVPGVSTYIHPMDEGHLLTIGIGGGEEGLGLDWRVTQLSQFNVTDFANPSLLHALPLTPVHNDDGQSGWTYAYSEATYEHKAFQYWKPLNLLAIPLSTYRYWNSGYGYQWEYVSKLVLVNAAPGENLSIYDELDHSAFYEDKDRGYRWYDHNFNIRRSIFMGDYIYAISSGGVTVHRIADMELMEAIQLDPAWEKHYYAYEESSDEKEEDR